MPLNKVTTNRRARGERALEIYRTIAPKLFQIRAVKRFLEKIEGELIVASRAHRETTAIYRDALSNVHRLREFRRGELKLGAAIAHSDPEHAPHFLDQSREHERSLIANSR